MFKLSKSMWHAYVHEYAHARANIMHKSIHGQCPVVSRRPSDPWQLRQADLTKAS